MGFSVTITSSIVIIVLFALTTSILITVFQGVREAVYATREYARFEREKLDVKIRLTVVSVNATSCNLTVENLGSKSIILRSQDGFNWNTVILSYGDGTRWQSYPIEDYAVLGISVSGTNCTFNVDNHPFINPGEEAKILIQIPNGAPEIPEQGLVSVAFVTHYGVVARGEAIRQ